MTGHSVSDYVPIRSTVHIEQIIPTRQVDENQQIVKLQPIVHNSKPKLNLGTSIPHYTLPRTLWAILLHPNDLPSGYITRRVAEITSTKFVASVSKEYTHPVFRTNKGRRLGDNGTSASVQGESAPPHTAPDCPGPPHTTGPASGFDRVIRAGTAESAFVSEFAGSVESDRSANDRNPSNQIKRQD